MLGCVAADTALFHQALAELCVPLGLPSSYPQPKRVLSLAMKAALAGNVAMQARVMEMARRFPDAPDEAWAEPALTAARFVCEARSVDEIAWVLDLLPGITMDDSEIFCALFCELFGNEGSTPCSAVLPALLSRLGSVAAMQTERPAPLLVSCLKQLRRVVLSPAVAPVVLFELLALYDCCREPVVLTTLRDVLRGCFKPPASVNKSNILTTAAADVVRAAAAFPELSTWCLNFYETMDVAVEIGDEWLLLLLLQACPTSAVSTRQRLMAQLHRGAESGGVREWAAHPAMAHVAVTLCDVLVEALAVTGSTWWCVPALAELCRVHSTVHNRLFNLLLARLQVPIVAQKSVKAFAALSVQPFACAVIVNALAFACVHLPEGVSGPFVRAVLLLSHAKEEWAVDLFRCFQRLLANGPKKSTKNVAARSLAVWACVPAIRSFPAWALRDALAGLASDVSRCFYSRVARNLADTLRSDAANEAAAAFALAPAWDDLFSHMVDRCRVFLQGRDENVFSVAKLPADADDDAGALIVATILLRKLRERLRVAGAQDVLADKLYSAFVRLVQAVSEDLHDGEGFSVQYSFVFGAGIDVLCAVGDRGGSNAQLSGLFQQYAKQAAQRDNCRCTPAGYLRMLSWVMEHEPRIRNASLACLRGLLRTVLGHDELCFAFANGVRALGRLFDGSIGGTVGEARVALLHFLLKCMREADALGVTVTAANVTACELTAPGVFHVRLLPMDHAPLGSDLLSFLCRRMKDHAAVEMDAAQESLLLAFLDLCITLSSAPNEGASCLLLDVLGIVPIASETAVRKMLALSIRLMPVARRIEVAANALRLALHNSSFGFDDSFLPLNRVGATRDRIQLAVVDFDPLLTPIITETLNVFAADKSRVDYAQMTAMLEACGRVMLVNPPTTVCCKLASTLREMMARLEPYMTPDMDDELAELVHTGLQLLNSLRKRDASVAPRMLFESFELKAKDSGNRRVAIALAVELDPVPKRRRNAEDGDDEIIYLEGDEESESTSSSRTYGYTEDLLRFVDNEPAVFE